MLSHYTVNTINQNFCELYRQMYFFKLCKLTTFKTRQQLCQDKHLKAFVKISLYIHKHVHVMELEYYFLNEIWFQRFYQMLQLCWWKNTFVCWTFSSKLGSYWIGDHLQCDNMSRSVHDLFHTSAMVNICFLW